MSEKKNIDRLFQEKFKDFEAAPPEFVWDNLEELLQKKKKRRVVPLWFRLSGVAAVLVVGMLFLYPFFTGTTPGGNSIVLDNPQPAPNGNQPGTNPLNTTVAPNRSVGNGKGAAINPDAIVSGNGDSNNSANAAANNNNNPIDNTPDNTTGGGSTAPSEYSNGQKNNGGSRNGNATGNRNNTVAGQSKNSSKRQNNKNQNIPGTEVQQGVAATNNKTQTIPGKATGGVGPVPGSDNTIRTPQQQNSAVAQQNTTTNSPGTNTTGVPPLNGNNSQRLQQNTGIAQQNTQPANSTTNPDGIAAPQNSIINRDVPVVPVEAVAETPVDTTAVKELNALEKRAQELLNPKKDDALAQTEADAAKWNIKPQMGPLLYSSLGNGSPIDGQFASNSKSYDNQLSVGLGVNYALSKKLSIRSGVNTVNLSYATQGVEFYASLNGQTSNVSRTSSASIIVQNQTATPNGIAAGFNADQLPQEKFSGSMMQKMGFIEVPVEMSYALLDKQFGIDLIGGVSTLFLNENNVSVVSNQGLSTDVGQAQNLNNVHFSTNIGIGFKYKFFKQFQASFEPTFKYQVNTFSRDAGNFKPYFIGLYTGVSFSF
jgi:hypothetical protein